MLSAASQTFAVVLIVAAAAGYLLLLVRRSWGASEHGACGGCHSNKAHAQSDSHGPIGSPALTDFEGPVTQPHTLFIPAENFADAARRHRAARDESPIIGSLDLAVKKADDPPAEESPT